jgi:hypothetical protein
MKKVILLPFAFVLLLAFSSMAFGQGATRITFNKGARSATVSGSLTGSRDHRTYVIRVRAGQTLTTESTGRHSITIGVEAPRGSTYEQDMAADCHDKNEVSQTAAGDYKITVTECVKADRWRGTFRFKVSVR